MDQNIVSIIQIAISIILIALIAFQQRGTALGSAFGGEGGFYSSKRGLQKKLHIATIAASAIFIALSLFKTFI